MKKVEQFGRGKNNLAPSEPTGKPNIQISGELPFPVVPAGDGKAEEGGKRDRDKFLPEDEGPGCLRPSVLPDGAAVCLRQGDRLAAGSRGISSPFSPHYTSECGSVASGLY